VAKTSERVLRERGQKRLKQLPKGLRPKQSRTRERPNERRRESQCPPLNAAVSSSSVDGRRSSVETFHNEARDDQPILIPGQHSSDPVNKTSMKFSEHSFSTVAYSQWSLFLSLMFDVMTFFSGLLLWNGLANSSPKSIYEFSTLSAAVVSCMARSGRGRVHHGV